MAFQTSPGEDFNFQKYGVTNGGSSTSKIEGRERTQEELLNHAASLPQPYSNLTKQSVKDRLKQLRAQYNHPSWHQHLIGTERYNLAGTINRLEGRNESIQSVPPGD